MQEAEKPGDRTIKAVIFDMDNTLCDFVEAKIRACDAVSKHLGRDDGRRLLNYFLRKKYDIEDPMHIADYLKDNERYSNITYQECSNIYRDTKINNIKNYQGLKEILRSLRANGMKIAVLTDANRKNARERLSRLEVTDLIDVLVTHDDTGKKKPDLEPFRHTMELLGMDAAEIAMVGDSPTRDIAPSKAMGFLTIYAEYGDRNFHENNIPDFDLSIGSLEELPKALGL